MRSNRFDSWFVGIIIVAIALLTIGYLVLSANGGTAEVRQASGDLWVWTDDETGCQYLGRSSYTITPRMDRDGKHICK